MNLQAFLQFSKDQEAALIHLAEDNLAVLDSGTQTDKTWESTQLQQLRGAQERSRMAAGLYLSLQAGQPIAISRALFDAMSPALQSDYIQAGGRLFD
jgi:hypothetical protein